MPSRLASVVAGKLATVSHQLTVSRRWRITFDEADTFGRHMIGAFREEELEVVEVVEGD